MFQRLVFAAVFVAIAPSIGAAADCGITLRNDRAGVAKTFTTDGGQRYHDLGGSFDYIERTSGYCSFHLGEGVTIPGRENEYRGRQATYGTNITRGVRIGAKDAWSRGWSARSLLMSRVFDHVCSVRLYNGQAEQEFWGPAPGSAPFVSGWFQVVDIDQWGGARCSFDIYTGDYYTGPPYRLQPPLRGVVWIDGGVRSIDIRRR